MQTGRRLYDAACVARLELIVTLRELGLGLPEVRRVLAGQAGVAEVAAVHLEALDAQIRTLRLRRGVLAAVVKRAADGKEMTMMNALARLSAAERRQIIDDFTDEVFAGLDPSPARFARWSAGPDLPEDPSPEQVEAWIELAGLAGDPDFRQQIRQAAEIGIARRSRQPGKPCGGGSSPVLPRAPGCWRPSWRGRQAAGSAARCWPSWRPPPIRGSNGTGS
jgi:DNA-binding transcriptional MerR regulator